MLTDPPRLHRHLPRLPAEVYHGQAVVHWIFGFVDRATGWLDAPFHAAWREILIHACGRFDVAARAACAMPDHIHLLSVGLHDGTNQTVFSAFLRKHLKSLLESRGPWRLQHQPFDHVLRGEERNHNAVRKLTRYISENPVRKGLVGRAEDYPYSDRILAGYPEINLWMPDAELRFERACAYVAMKKGGNP